MKDPFGNLLSSFKRNIAFKCVADCPWKSEIALVYCDV